jgi:hypothetical protein
MIEKKIVSLLPVLRLGLSKWLYFLKRINILEMVFVNIIIFQLPTFSVPAINIDVGNSIPRWGAYTEIQRN